MSTVEPGAFLTLHYRLSGPQGDVINTFGKRPSTISLGTGQLAPAVEERLIGMEEGTPIQLELTPDQTADMSLDVVVSMSIDCVPVLASRMAVINA